MIWPQGHHILGLDSLDAIKNPLEDDVWEYFRVCAHSHRLCCEPEYVVANVVHYCTQKSARHILIYLNGTFLSGAPHKA